MKKINQVATAKFKFLLNAVNLFVVISFFVAGTSCRSSAGISQKSPDAPKSDYQNRTPEQLLKIIASHNIKNLQPGEYLKGDNWETVVKSKEAQAEWFGYPMGVTLLGLQRANELLKEQKIKEYVEKYNVEATKTYIYYLWQKEKFGKTINDGGAFNRIVRMNMLDDCGAESAEMLESVLRNGVTMTPEMLLYLQNVANYISNTVDRMPDGSFWRPISPGSRSQSQWADDLFMSCPFLIRWSEYTHDTKYLDDAAQQIINFASLLQDTDGVWWHAYLVDLNKPARFKWGRANGWVMVATAEVLSALPENHPKRQQLLEIFRKHIEGLKKYQSESGLWNQVLDHPELKWGVETSCSAMFGYAIARAVNKGWIDKSNLKVVKKAIDGLNRKVLADGSILGVCQSCSIGDNLQYYDERPTRLDDYHGPGPLMLILSEYLKAK